MKSDWIKDQVARLWAGVSAEKRGEKLRSVALALFDLLPPSMVTKEDRALLAMITLDGLGDEQRTAQLARATTPRTMLMQGIIAGDVAQASMLFLAMLGVNHEPDYALGRLADHLGVPTLTEIQAGKLDSGRLAR